MIIYLDVLAVLNFGMDYGILRAAGKISGRSSTFIRTAAASCIGSAYACLCVLFPEFALKPIRLFSAAVITRTAFECVSTAVWVRMTLTVALVSMVFGGCVCGLEAACGGNFYENGVLTAPVSMGVLFASALLSYVISGIVFHREASMDAPKRENVCITAGERTANVLLMRDSGNKLTDTKTGLPVLILTRQRAEKLFPEAVRDAEKSISYRTLSGEGVMDSFIPTEIRREDGQRYRAVIALTDSVLGADCDGLIADTNDERRSYEKVLECSFDRD